MAKNSKKKGSVIKKNTGGRPSKYAYWLTEDGLAAIKSWKRRDLSNEEIARLMDISPSTLQEWAKRFPEFSEALKKSKEVAIAVVENALFENCKAGDNTAIIFYLTNQSGGRYINTKYINTRAEIEEKQVVENKYLSDIRNQLKNRNVNIDIDKLE